MSVALIVIDMLNRYEHKDAGLLDSVFRNMRAHTPPCQEALDVAVTVEAPE